MEEVVGYSTHPYQHFRWASRQNRTGQSLSYDSHTEIPSTQHESYQSIMSLAKEGRKEGRKEGGKEGRRKERKEGTNGRRKEERKSTECKILGSHNGAA